jgi:hypothetical protein
MKNQGDGKRKYRMDFIPDKKLYAAVMFARKMIRQGVSPGLANYKAAEHYGFSTSQVARYVGQFGGRSRKQ